MKKARIDAVLAERGLFPSRSAAAGAVRAGEVRVGEDVEPEEHVVSGRPAEVAARLNDFRKMGFSAMNFMLSGPDTTEQAERLAREVIPELREMA